MSVFAINETSLFLTTQGEADSPTCNTRRDITGKVEQHTSRDILDFVIYLTETIKLEYLFAGGGWGGGGGGEDISERKNASNVFVTLKGVFK